MDVVLVGLSLPGVENLAIGALRAALRSNDVQEAFVPFGGFASLDDQGRAVGFRLSDGDAGDPAIADCLRNVLADYCYPSFAGKTIHAFIPHFLDCVT